MDGADGSRHYQDETNATEQSSSSLLTIIIDTNPAAWALLQPVLPLSSLVANLLVFINAHLACNYTNEVALIASHCDKAQWLYPPSTPQKPARPASKGNHGKVQANNEDEDEDIPVSRSKRLRTNGTSSNGTTNGTSTLPPDPNSANKYRPFRLLERDLLKTLTLLIHSTSPPSLHENASTKIAGALSLALSYINRRSRERQESFTGITSSVADTTVAANPDPSGNNASGLQSRILIITLSPSADLAHQYIPIMNSIFACQKLNIPIDVLHLPLSHDATGKQTHHPQQTDSATTSTPPNPSTTVFLQQASDATSGIFLLAQLGQNPTPSTASPSLLNYLLTAFLPSGPSSYSSYSNNATTSSTSSSDLTTTVSPSRSALHPPTLISVDFRTACFCHRNVIDTGYVCSICLSIFCELSLGVLGEEGCLTCGSQVGVRGEGVGGWMGRRPVVVAKKRRKKGRGRGVDGGGSRFGTPVPG